MKKLFLIATIILSLILAFTSCDMLPLQSEEIEDVITVEDGYLVVNGVKTEYKVADDTVPEEKDDVITVVDGYLVVNGVKTEYKVADDTVPEEKDDVITVVDGYLVVNGVKTEYKVADDTVPEEKDDVITVVDGYLVVNGVKTEYKVADDTPVHPVCTHAQREENRVEATCSQNGSYDIVTYCTVCDKEFDRTTVTIDTIPHTPGEWIADSEADCVTDGSCHKECQRCSKWLTTEIIPAKGHSYVDGYCTHCGEKDPDVVPEDTNYSVGLEYMLSYDGTYYTVVGIGSCTDISIVIPNTYNSLPVTEIYWGAFCNDAISRSFVIPKSITNIMIGMASMHPFGMVTEITVDIDNPVYKSVDGNLYSKDGKVLLVYAGQKMGSIFTIPEGTEVVGLAAFWHSEFLEVVAIPKSVTSIEAFAFGYTHINVVYYGGTEAEWKNVKIDSNNDDILDALIYYYSETQPTSAGLYWCYKDGDFFIWPPYIPSHKHEYTAVITTPTCTEQGYTTYTCNCGDSYIDSYTSALGHTPCDWMITSSATCVREGLRIKVCLVCQETTADEYIPATGVHNFADGICIMCGGKDPNFKECEHDWIPSTCTESTYCTICGRTAEGPMGHSWIAPTCAENGYCERCGAIGAMATGHTEEIIPKIAATCATTGLTEGKRCSICGTVLAAQEEIPATGMHIFVDGFCFECAEIDPDYSGECTCDYTLVDKYAPSCEYDGEYVYVCNYCGEYYYEWFADPLGHDYVDGFCSRCGEADPNYTPVTPDYPKGLEYTSNGDGTCYVSGIGSCTDEYIVIPEKSPQGWTVTAIGSSAFYGCAFIKNVSISATVTNIGSQAFGECTSLVEITIPEGPTNLDSVFYRCTSLKKVVLPDSLKSLDMCTFMYCYALEEIVIGPDSALNVISQDVFYDCTSLTTIFLPKTVTNIIHNPFNGCTNLSVVYYGGTESDWNSINFFLDGNDKLKYATRYYYSETQPTTEGNFWHWVDGVPTVWDTVAKHIHSYTDGNCTSCGETDVSLFNFSLLANGTYEISAKEVNNLPNNILLPNTYNNIPVTKIADYGFTFCFNATTFTIPDGIISIGSNAFYCFAGLENITISKTVTDIHASAFSECAGIESLTVASDNPVYYSSGNCLIERNTNTLIASEKYCVIPEGVIAIGDYSCSRRDYAVNVIVPDGVTSIGYCSFGACLALKSIVLPNNLTVISKWAFGACTQLKIIYYKGTEAEWNSINIATDNDDLLNATRYYYSETQPTTAGNFWHYVDGVPTAWGTYVEPNYSVGLEFTSNGDGTCYVSGFGTCNDAAIIIPEVSPEGCRVTGIKWAFYSCQSITSVVISDSVITIGDGAFKSCYSLSSVVLGKNVKTIGYQAFTGTDLISITIPDSVTSISGCAFQFCKKLSYVVISNNVVSIDDTAFESCPELKTVYYGGSESEWDSINIGAYNNELLNATRYYYSETAPTIEGNFWRWVDGAPTVW